MKKLSPKILLSGGGTGGPVSPLLAIVDSMRKNKNSSPDFYWIGTCNGPEREMVEKENIYFKSITAGKWPRYISWQNFIAPFLVLIGLAESFYWLLKIRPGLVISAGGFVSVPVVWAAWLIGIPILIHQQDARPGLANKLMSGCAKKVTVSFAKSISDYPNKAVWVGNPVRNSILEMGIGQRSARQKLGLDPGRSTLLVVGGGTGAVFINDMIIKNLNKLLKFCQILHITGRGKETNTKSLPGYHSFPFLLVDGMAKAFFASDAIVSRGGMGLLTELSILGKPSILIPIPDSHQEDNANIFFRNEAAIVLDQKNFSEEVFINSSRLILHDNNVRNKLKHNLSKIFPPDANRKITEEINKIVTK